jgi:hypothetical protein
MSDVIVLLIQHIQRIVASVSEWCVFASTAMRSI